MLSLNQAPIQFDQRIEEAFPDVDPGITPFGSRVLVQIRVAKTKSAGGIELVTETREAVQYNTQVGMVRSLGPLAFKNRTTLEAWPEGQWCKKGEFVRVPKYGGDRWERPIPNSEDMALFVIFNDLDIIGRIDCNPLEIIAFL